MIGFRALQQTISNAQSGGTTTSSFSYNANNFLTYVATTGASAKAISDTTDKVGQYKTLPKQIRGPGDNHVNGLFAQRARGGWQYGCDFHRHVIWL